MSSEEDEKYAKVMSDTLNEINEILGYTYFDATQIEELVKAFVKLVPFIKSLLLKDANEVTVKKFDTEPFDSEKGKQSSLQGIFDGLVLKGYEGDPFEEKFKNYLYNSGIEKSEWISKTGYDDYYNILLKIVSMNPSNLILLKLVYDYRKEKLLSITQGFTKILMMEDFFKNVSTLDETIIDEHFNIFRELGGIVENHLKLLYAIKHNYSSGKDINKLGTSMVSDIWKDLKNDKDYSIFTKPFPNTIYWNASKRSGIIKKVTSKEIEFKSNEGTRTLSYSDLISLVRELYACALVLIKIGLIIRFHHKVF